jgi:hypothetical protein
MTNKLPAYFENYLEEKFSTLSEKLDEQSRDLGGRMDKLKSHVNDEIQIIRQTIQKLEKMINRLYWISALLFVLLLIHDLTNASILDVMLKIFMR